uniref:Uncharacterized protein n=1 Tax=Sphaerodactylus townsendi TaxID=933632 RepID=A0ACB8G5K7_9SAUR
MTEPVHYIAITAARVDLKANVPEGGIGSQFVQRCNACRCPEDICHQILDLYSQGKQQMPHHTPHQLQQPPSLQGLTQVTPPQQTQQSQSSEPSQPQPQKESQQAGQQQQPPPPPQTPQSKKPSPQSSPPRQTKRPAAVSPKEETKTAEAPPPKIAKMETSHPPAPPAHPPPANLGDGSVGEEVE